VIAVVALGIVLAILSIGFIVLPFVRGPGNAEISLTPEGLLARRDRIYGELRELEFDRNVGKLSLADYQESRTRLETEAARVLRALDTRQSTVDDDIERDVLAWREGRNVCLTCETPIDPSLRFCPACGAAQAIGTR